MLEGVIVLDLSRVLAGPYATMLLADLGARVIKIEHPAGGDITRGWGPPFDSSGEAAYFLGVNRNKESIALDLATPAGRRSVEILARHADVLVENFPPGALERMGVSLESLRKANPRLVVASISGFGETGPERDRTGFDLLAQAGAGLMAITGDPDGPPQKVGVAVSDIVCGLHAAVGIAAALVAARSTGEGTHLRVDLFSSTLSILANVVQACLVSGREAGRHGTGHAQIVPYQRFAASDGEFILAVGTDRQFRALCEKVIDRPAWAADPKLSENRARVAARDGLVADLAAIFLSAPRQSWLDRCHAAGVPAGPVRGPLEALQSEQARALGLLVRDGTFATVASPIRLSGPAPVRRPPKLDENGAAIRKEFGLE